MKPCSSFFSSTLALLLGALALTGCAGNLNFPDSTVTSQVAGPALAGSVFGGHSPIQGAHVYLLQPGTTGYGSKATSILGTGTTTSPGGFTLASDTADPNVTVGSKYVTTNSSGSFNLTGAYACTAGQPVYIYAYGGNVGTTTGPYQTNYTISKIVVTNSTSGTNGTATFTVTISAGATLTTGESVTIAGLTGNFTNLNAAQTVTAVPSGTTFSFVATSSYSIAASHHNLANGTYTTSSFGTGATADVTTTGTVTATANNSIVQLATLGNCPSSGNFSTGSTALSFIYMNEVSTVVTAYTFQPFTLSTNNTAWDIGTPNTTQALLGIANAANTAAVLYNIQGNGPASTVSDGEGHIANQYTPAPAGDTNNGIVPQETIDSLANIIAACVDSVSLPSSVTIQCNDLFSIATDNGETGGTAPTDTATAAINIARYPAGNNSTGSVDATYAADLNSIPTGTVPFVPSLGTATPNDWTIAISYPSNVNANMGNPESIAVDGSGNVFFSNQSTGYITKLLPTGFPSFNYNAGVTPGYLTIDPTGSPTTPTNNNIWFGAINGTSSITELTNTGALKAKSPAIYSTVSTAATDSSGNFYFVSATPGLDTYKLTSTFTSATNSPFTGSATCIPTNPGFDTYDHLTIDGAQRLWVADERSGIICRFTTTGAVSFDFPVTTATNAFPEAIGIDASGSAWVTLEDANEVDYITLNPGNGKPSTTTYTSTSTGATFSEPFSATVDGAGNVWITNRTSNSITELANGGTAISPTNNYQFGSGILSDPLNAAIDPSGNVWISNYGGQKVVELVGAAAPTVTPLSYASGASGLGAKP